MKLRVAIAIDAPLAAVWDEVAVIERHVDWMSEAESIAFAGAQHSGTGTVFDCRTRVGPFRTVDRMVVTEWVPGRAIGIEHHGAVSGRGRFALRRTRRGVTSFTWTERLRFPWWLGGPVGARVARPMLRRIWRRNLGRLKQIVETGHA